jgi:hypothetical protein
MRIERPIDLSTFYLLLRLNDATRSLPALPSSFGCHFRCQLR